MNIILTVISDLLLSLLAVYVGVAIATIWRHQDWSLLRFLPLVAVAVLITAAMVPPRFSMSVLCVALPLLAAACVQAWRGRAWLDRSLRMLSAFWLLWVCMSVVRGHL